MREFLSLLILPVPVLFLLLIAAFFFLWRKRKRTGKILLLISGCWLLVITTRPIPVLLIKNLENKYPQLSDSIIKKLPDSVNIIVLGSGHSDDTSLSPNNQLSSVALGRLVEAIRIYKGIKAKEEKRGSSGLRAQGAEDPGDERLRYETTTGRQQPVTNVRMVVSGYSGRSKLSQAEVLYKTAMMLGVDTSDVVLSPLPSNTITEAEEYVAMSGTERQLVVVTSAIHMKRSLMMFRTAGVKVIPAPTNHILKYGSEKDPWRWVPQSGYISLMEQAVHEYMGILWYKLGGR